ncbi:unnamed protein product [Calypogeia fissa]
MAMAEQQQRQEQNRPSSSSSSSTSPSPEMLSSSNELEFAQKATRAPPKGLNSPFTSMSQQKNGNGNASAPPRRPSPEEMIDYYTKKGLDKEAATKKVIDDLQKALTIAVSRYPKKAQEVEKSVRSVSGTLDAMATRLSAVEAKLDEKPDLGGVFMAGVAAGGFLQAVPHIVKAISQVGNSIRDTISSKQQ